MAKGKKTGAVDVMSKLESDAVERRKMFKELQRHVENGYSMDCFGPLSLGSIEKFLKDYPLEFVVADLEQSIRKAKAKWESIGERQSNGSCIGNSRSWVYNMINRYKWTDRVQVEAEHKGAVAINIVSYADQSTAST